MGTLVEFFRTDIVPGLTNIVGWQALSRRKLDSLNRRTQFGLYWVALSTFIFIMALSLVYSAIFSVPLSQYIPYISIGYAVWGFISNTIASAPGVFVTNATYITQRPFPLSLYIVSESIAKFFIFLIQFSVSIAACVFFAVKPTFALLVLPISFFIIIAWAAGVFLLLGVVSVKYRDVGQLVQSLLFIIFLCTPILWDADILQGRAMFVELNPIYHLIHIIRSPILDGTVPYGSLVAAAGFSASCVLAGSLCAARYGRRIVFWL